MQKRDGGGSFPLPLRQPQPQPPRVEERAGGGLFRHYDPAQCRRCHPPAPSSLGKTSRRCGGLDPPTLPRHRRAHLPRIEQRAGGGSSALWLPAGVVAASVVAAPTLSACRSKLREWVACWVGRPVATPLLVRSQGRAGVVFGTLLPRYHQPKPTTWPPRPARYVRVRGRRPRRSCRGRRPISLVCETESDMGVLFRCFRAASHAATHLRL